MKVGSFIGKATGFVVKNWLYIVIFTVGVLIGGRFFAPKEIIEFTISPNAVKGVWQSFIVTTKAIEDITKLYPDIKPIIIITSSGDTVDLDSILPWKQETIKIEQDWKIDHTPFTTTQYLTLDYQGRIAGWGMTGSDVKVGIKIPQIQKNFSLILSATAMPSLNALLGYKNFLVHVQYSPLFLPQDNKQHWTWAMGIGYHIRF